jgi:hypothetical protein
MTDVGENIKAIPLLEAYVRAVPASEREESYAYDEARRNLFEAYVETGAWQKGEKMYLEGYRENGNELGQIAVSAAKAGRPADAIRLWKLNANLDRRKLGELHDLAKTSLKPELRQFYLDMKKSDPMTGIPENALTILK